MNNDDQPPKIIPSNFDRTNVSPTADKIVKIYKDGNVDFFIKCGGWGTPVYDKKDKKYTYYKISFQVKKNFYNKNYGAVDNFVGAIENEQIEDLTVSIIQPNRDLTNQHETCFEATKITGGFGIKIKNILNRTKKIWDGGWTIAMANVLIDHGRTNEALELYKKENSRIAKLINNIKDTELQQKLDEKDKELTKLKNENERLKQCSGQREQQLKKNKELEKLFKGNKEVKELVKEKEELEKKLKEKNEIYNEMLKEKTKYTTMKFKENEELKRQLNKKDEEYNKLLKANQELERLLKENERLEKQLLKGKDEKYNKLSEAHTKLQRQLKDEYIKKVDIKTKDLNKDVQEKLYKKKEKGFLSIFSCCTCGLDNVAEKEDEMKLIGK